MNVELLRKIQQHVLDNPQRLVMNTFIIRKTDDETPYNYAEDKFFADDDTPTEFAECGTAACIAGWTLILSQTPIPPFRREIADIAQKLLGIEFYQSKDLFYLANWNAIPRRRYHEATSQYERALIVSDVIDDFIAKYENEKKEPICV